MRRLPLLARLLLGLELAVVLSTAVRGDGPAKRPNVVFIFSDDEG